MRRFSKTPWIPGVHQAPHLGLVRGLFCQCHRLFAGLGCQRPGLFSGFAVQECIRGLLGLLRHFQSLLLRCSYPRLQARQPSRHAGELGGTTLWCVLGGATMALCGQGRGCNDVRKALVAAPGIAQPPPSLCIDQEGPPVPHPSLGQLTPHATRYELSRANHDSPLPPQPPFLAGCHSQRLARPVPSQGGHRTVPVPLQVGQAVRGLPWKAPPTCRGRAGAHAWPSKGLAWWVGCGCCTRRCPSITAGCKHPAAWWCACALLSCQLPWRTLPRPLHPWQMRDEAPWQVWQLRGRCDRAAWHEGRGG